MTTVINNLKALEVEHKWCVHETFTDEKTLAVVKNLAERGFNQTMIAQAFGMSQRTFARRLESNSHLREAYYSSKKKGLANLMNTAYVLGTSGLDPQMTRYMIDKIERDAGRENQKVEDDESAIDVASRPTGSLKPEEIKAIVKDAYEMDPMLKDDDEDNDSSP